MSSELSEETKKIIDDAVYECVIAFSRSPGTLQTLHFGEPSYYHTFVVSHINMNSAIRGRLSAVKYTSFTSKERSRMVVGALKRLLRQCRIRRAKLPVPVSTRGPDGSKKIVMQKMRVYIPTTVLDEIANA